MERFVLGRNVVFLSLEVFLMGSISISIKFGFEVYFQICLIRRGFDGVERGTGSGTGVDLKMKGKLDHK